MMIKKIIILILLTSFLFSSVNIKAAKTFMPNENMYFEIEAFGKDVSFPKITKIQELSVQKAGQSKSISNINGRISTKITKRYFIRPQKDFIIPSFSILIDGVYEKTKVLHIKKQKLTKTKSDYFDLNISLEEKTLFVGEQSVLTMSFKYKEGLQIINSSLSNVDFKNFWFKTMDAKKAYKKDGYIVQDLKYILFPQKEGILKIEPLRVDLSLLDANSNEFFSFRREAKIVNIYSNSLEVEVKKLKGNAVLIGDFSITSSIDKNEIKEGEAVSFKLNIEGFGNIDDLEDIKLDIKDTTIYENKAKISSKIINDLYFAKYEKTFSILAKRDFIIPSIKLRYFDEKLQKILIKETKSFKIKVKAKVQKEIKLEKSINISTAVKNDLQNKEIFIKSSLFTKSLYFIMGIIFTLLTIGLYFYVINKSNKKQDLPIIIKIKKASCKKDLLKCLFPYLSKNEKLDSLIFDIEKTDNKNLSSLKKEIIEILKEFK